MGTRDTSPARPSLVKTPYPKVAEPCSPHSTRGLASALERYDDTLKALFASLEILDHKSSAGEDNITTLYLSAIENLTRGCANAVALYKDRCLTRSSAPAQAQNTLAQLFRDALRHQPQAFDLAPHARLLDTDDGTLAILPMHEDAASGIVIHQPRSGSLDIDEVIYFTLKKIYTLSHGFTQAVPLSQLKAHIYDLLKQRYQYVSQHVYDERFALFKAEIETIAMHFEPIYNFDNVHQSEIIYSWEALARTGDGNRAPVHILQAAELWGTRFKTELDIHVLEQSIVTYCEETRRAKISRQNEIRPLSINLYPDTLFRPAYHAKLEELLRQRRLIRGSNLILEISEKSIINEHGEGDTVDKFLRHMDDLRERYGLAFAIDDFGAGYSSIVRLNALKPEWVKIDREVLLCEPRFAKTLIKNLLSIKTEWARPAFRVIIEGLDTDSKIGLDELLGEVGVEYIQGYLLGKARPTIIERAEEAHGESIRACAGWLAHPTS